MRVAAVLSMLFVVACGGPSVRVDAHESASSRTAPEALARPASAPVDVRWNEPTRSVEAPYEVHEWGLVDVAAWPNGPFEVAAGPGRPPEPDIPRPVRKPVLYFHRDGGAPIDVSVSATLRSGTIHEHWPPAEVSGDRVTWPRVRLDDAACPPLAAAPTRGPRDAAARREVPTPHRDERHMERPRCATPDGVCEISELPFYVSADATCLEVGNTRARLLFYRGVVERDALPVYVERVGDLVRVAGRGASSAGVGAVIRLVRREPNDVRIARGHVATPSAYTELPMPTERVDEARERGALKELLAIHGLTDGEADAFVDAWAPSFFGREGTDEDVVLYFLSERDVDAIAELSFTPPPRAVRRAMMVRVLVPAEVRRNPTRGVVPVPR